MRRAGLYAFHMAVPHATLGWTVSPTKSLPSSKTAKPLSPSKGRLGLMATGLLRHDESRKITLQDEVTRADRVLAIKAIKKD